MNIHSQSYPHTTTKADPAYVRPPATLHEHYRANPMGRTFKEWIEDRIVELLSRPGFYVCDWNLQLAKWRFTRIGRAYETASFYAKKNNEYARLELTDGTIIKEWSAQIMPSADHG
jgi:hypothetical protein